MMEKLACKNSKIRNYLWNSAEKQISNEETFL